MIRKNSWLALTTVIGGTLGAGLFGVPYVFAHAGVLQGTLRTVVIGVVLIILNLLQAEVSLTIPGTTPLGWLMKKLLPGRRWFVGIFIVCMQFFIALFAYISLVGAFVNTFLGSAQAINPAITATVYSLLIGRVVYKGIAGIKKYDKTIVMLFLCTLLFLIIYGFFITTPSHFLLADKTQRFLPYGVLIYALNSVSSVPLLENILGRERKNMPYIIIIGGIICMSAVLLRGWAVVGISWMATSPDALSWLQTFLPPRVVKISGLVGILAIISPHLLISEHLKETLKQSFHFHTIDAWTTVVILPLIAYLFIQSDFVGTIGFAGAIFTGLVGVFIGVMNLRLHKKYWKKETYILPRNKGFSYMVIILFSLGVIYECLKEFVL